MAYMTRQTYWTDERSQVVQVAFAWLDDCWELQAEVVRSVGPFDDAGEVLHEAMLACAAERDRQMAGQQLLEL